MENLHTSLKGSKVELFPQTLPISRAYEVTFANFFFLFLRKGFEVNTESSLSIFQDMGSA